MKLLIQLKLLRLKNKTKTYLLLVVVLGIWGVIGYKIWSGFNTEVPEAKQQEFAVSFNPKTNTVIDTFSVQTAERDPFLGTLTLQKLKKTNTTKSKKQDNFVWLPISYQGLVKKQDSKEEVFIVNIRGKQYVLKLGQKIDSVTLVKGNIKNIVVRYKNKQKTIDIL